MDVAGEAVTASKVFDLSKQERRGFLASDAQTIGFVDGLVYRLVDDVGRHRILLGNGIGDKHASLQTHVQFCLESGGEVLRRVNAVIYLETAVALVLLTTMTDT